MEKCAFTPIELAGQAKRYVSPANGLFKQSSTKTNIGESRVSEFGNNMGYDPLKLSWLHRLRRYGWFKVHLKISLESLWKKAVWSRFFTYSPHNSVWGFYLCTTGFLYLDVLTWAFQRKSVTIKSVQFSREEDALSRVFSSLFTPVQLWEEECASAPAHCC